MIKRKTVATFLIVLGIAFLVAGISIQAFPEWLSIPGGMILLLVGALVGVAEIGGKLKDWRDLLFGEEKNKVVGPPHQSVPIQRSQEMLRSESSQQVMHGRGGTQKQKMTDSPGSKQQMD